MGESNAIVAEVLTGLEERVRPDGWTVETDDGSLSAHFEHTIAITEDGSVILSSRA